MCVQVYKAMRHGITEVAVKMVSCVVSVRESPERTPPLCIILEIVLRQFAGVAPLTVSISGS